MPDFRPNQQYVREMKRFGVLPADFKVTADPIDPFETDQRYWKLFWYHPTGPVQWPYLEQTSARSKPRQYGLTKVGRR
jgi:hypothetical protein